MLEAGLFDEFRGFTTLLLWGDRDGIATLLARLSALQKDTRAEFVVEGRPPLTVTSTSGRRSASHLEKDASGFRWLCSADVLKLAADLVEPLQRGAGHQYLDVSGLAEQVIISRDEYPADLR
jgi:hypothetical protein